MRAGDKTTARDMVRLGHAMLEEADGSALTAMGQRFPTDAEPRLVALAAAHMARALALYRTAGMSEHEIAAHLRRWAKEAGHRH